MQKIILQPAGDGDARKHYVDTIENLVPLEKIQSFVPEETFSQLQSLFPKGFIPVWGVTPGKGEGNKKKWERVERGDIALFSRDKAIVASASVVLTIHNKELAFELWKTNKDGEAWEYIYFLDEVTNQQIPYEHFNNAIGYHKDYIIQGFNVLDEEKSLRALELLDLKSEIYFPEIHKEEYFKAVSEPKPDEPLDKVVRAKSRTEQSYLRNYLFKGKRDSNCGICGKEYPVDFLIAAHIKKRADCTEEERRDYQHIIMPMCKFGCDDLYEKGYIVVEEGKVMANLNKYSTLPIKEYLTNIINAQCSYWSTETEKYFSWHCKLHKK